MNLVCKWGDCDLVFTEISEVPNLEVPQWAPTLNEPSSSPSMLNSMPLMHLPAKNVAALSPQSTPMPSLPQRPLVGTFAYFSCHVSSTDGLAPAENLSSASSHSYIIRPPGPELGTLDSSNPNEPSANMSITVPIQVSARTSSGEVDSSTQYDTSSKSDSQLSQTHSQPTAWPASETLEERSRSLTQRLVSSQLPPPPVPPSASIPIRNRSDDRGRDQTMAIESQAPARSLALEGSSSSDDDESSFHGPLSSSYQPVIASVEVGGVRESSALPADTFVAMYAPLD